MEKKNYLYSFPEVWKAIWQLQGNISQPSDNAFKLTGDNLSDSQKVWLYNKFINRPICYDLWKKDGFEVYISENTYRLSNSLIDINTNSTGSNVSVELNNTQYTNEELVLELMQIFGINPTAPGTGGDWTVKSSGN